MQFGAAHRIRIRFRFIQLFDSDPMWHAMCRDISISPKNGEKQTFLYPSFTGDAARERRIIQCFGWPPLDRSKWPQPYPISPPPPSAFFLLSGADASNFPPLHQSPSTLQSSNPILSFPATEAAMRERKARRSNLIHPHRRYQPAPQTMKNRD